MAKKIYDKLEEFVLEHRDEFDFLEPPKGLWSKIDSTDKKVFHISGSPFRRIIGKVASVILIFTLSYFANDFIRDYRNGTLAEKQRNSLINKYMQLPEMKEATDLYNVRFTDMMTEINQYADEYPEVVNDLVNEIKDLDTEFNSLENDLVDGVSNEEIIEAMIKVYKFKLMILHDCLQEIQMEEGVEPNKEMNYEESFDI